MEIRLDLCVECECVGSEGRGRYGMNSCPTSTSAEYKGLVKGRSSVVVVHGPGEAGEKCSCGPSKRSILPVVVNRCFASVKPAALKRQRSKKT
jgi:hypothetical protein